MLFWIFFWMVGGDIYFFRFWDLTFCLPGSIKDICMQIIVFQLEIFSLNGLLFRSSAFALPRNTSTFTSLELKYFAFDLTVVHPPHVPPYEWFLFEDTRPRVKRSILVNNILILYVRYITLIFSDLNFFSKTLLLERM